MAKRNLNVAISNEEWRLLERFAKENGRTKTDVLRELIRSLPPAPYDPKLRLD